MDSPGPGRLLFLVLLALGIVLPVRAFVVEPIMIPTGSMEPTLRIGAHLFSDKLTLRARPLRRGDIIVFRPPTGQTKELVKRVIGLPGETVERRSKTVYVDGKPLEEPYAVHKRAEERLEGDDMAPVTVPKDAYFVLGDNRDESEDSSVWRDEQGQPLRFVPRGHVTGLVRGIY